MNKSSLLVRKLPGGKPKLGVQEENRIESGLPPVGAGLLDVKDECLRMAWNITSEFSGPIRELKPRF